jgi:DNA topoisomerase-1
MSVAQNLYQNWFITYMRTDSVNLSDLAIQASKKYIEENFWKEYSLPHWRKFKNKQANAQEAHEAIRPSYIEKNPENVWLDWNDIRLYKLIWERTIASQMKEALIETTTYIFSPDIASNQEWITKWEVIKFPGFMKLYIEWTDDETEESETMNLPILKVWEKAKSSHLLANQVFTRPPSRYTEAALVKKLESEWIWRPSTYAPTISTIVDRWYVEKIDKKLAPTEIAFIVNDFLMEYFKKMMDYKFTAKIEEELDTIATGWIEWIKMLELFYTDFKKDLLNSDENAEKVIEKTWKKCPECKEWDLLYKYSKNWKFIGCSRYPECKYLENIVDPQKEELLWNLKEKYEWKPCEAWGTIVVKTWRFWPFLASSLYPEVKWIGKIPNEKNIELEEKFGWDICEKCWTGIVHVKSSRRWPFLACSAYPECKNAKNLPKEKQE